MWDNYHAAATSALTAFTPSPSLSSAIPTSSTHHALTSGKAPSMTMSHFQPGRESWIAICAVVLSLTLSYTVQRIKARRAIQARQGHTRSQKSDLPPSDVSAESPLPSRPSSTLLPAIKARLNTCLYLYIIPPWLYAPETSMDAIWTGVYCIMMLFCAVWKCPRSRDQYPYLFLANRFGILAYAQTPLIFLLAVKNNPLSPITGITYQKLNYMHRASARVCITFAWLHAALWFIPVLYAGHLFHWYIVWGTVALVSFTGLWITSIRSLRRKSFEFFLVTHIIFSAAFILGAILHWPLKAYWIWPALAIWTLDRLIRIIRVIYINRIHKTRGSGAVVDNCRVEVVSRDVMRVTIVRQGLKWKAGQHFFISSPGTGGSRHESHPFSIANMPNAEGEAIFLIRSHNGFTRRLLDLAPTFPPLLLEGAYGHSHPLTHYTSLLLISGGTGVTFTLSHFLSLLNSIRSGRSIARRIKMVWHVRHAEDISWITPILDDALSEECGGKPFKDLGVKIEVEVWVTRSKSSSEPWDLAGFGQTVPSTPIWTRPPSLRSGEAGAVGEAGYGYGSLSDDGEERVVTPPSSSGSGVMAERERGVEREEVSEMTRLMPSLGRTGSSISIAGVMGGFGRGKLATFPTFPTLGTSPVRYAHTPHSPSPLSRVQQLPPSSQSPSSPSPTQQDSSVQYISPQTQRIMSLHPGRADLLATITNMADHTTEDEEGGRMIVVACGPVALMNDTRNAVGKVNSWSRIRNGVGREVEFLEETVGH